MCRSERACCVGSVGEPRVGEVRREAGIYIIYMYCILHYNTLYTCIKILSAPRVGEVDLKPAYTLYTYIYIIILSAPRVREVRLEAGGERAQQRPQPRPQPGARRGVAAAALERHDAGEEDVRNLHCIREM
jgi:hypothetical protein